MNKFREDLEALIERLKGSVSSKVIGKADELKEELVNLKEKKIVKINHSVMELLCAVSLLMKGYGVKVEHPIDEDLVCDLYGWKGDGTLIVEVETGFVPPDHALDPISYRRARIASKIVRYGYLATKFGLASPPNYIMQIPPLFVKPPRDRGEEEIEKIKRLCDVYYRNPPVSTDEILNTRLHAVYIINVDEASVREIDPLAYIERTQLMIF